MNGMLIFIIGCTESGKKAPPTFMFFSTKKITYFALNST
jgi:hypothetical protein